MRPLLWLALAAIVMLSVALVGAPVWLIQPFAPQTPDVIAWSHAIKQAARVVTPAALVATLLLAIVLWRRAAAGRRASSPWRRVTERAAIVPLVVVAAGSAWFSRQNHFEWMFRPNPDPVFVHAREETGVDAADPVIAVTLGNESLAFPITRIGYHHLVNTTLVRQPIVATY
jgi:hypothetical protein